MSVEVKYSCLCEEVLTTAQACIDENALKVLKGYYANYIDSNRKLSQIKDVRTLFRVLEKRDILSYNNVKPLFYISNNFLNDSYLQKKIQDYKVYIDNLQYSCFYNTSQGISASTQSLKGDKDNNKTENGDSSSRPKLQNVKCECQSASQSHVTNSMTYPKQEEMLQQMILSQLSEKIGRSWRDTARFLGIPEYQIDIIQNKYPFDLKEQSYEALKLCISQYSIDNWEINLLHALERARRRDLRELTEKLICTRIE